VHLLVFNKFCVCFNFSTWKTKTLVYLNWFQQANIFSSFSNIHPHVFILYGIKCADVNECNAHCPSIIMKLPTTFIIVFGGETMGEAEFKQIMSFY